VKIWVGLKQDDKYVHEWIGEVSEEDIPGAIRDVLIEYLKKGNSLWGLNILFDRA
jgi:hypothetical protein